MGHTDATLPRSPEPRQIQPADFVRTSAHHRIPDLPGRWSHVAARLSLLRTRAGSALVWDFRCLTRNHSRTAGLHPRAHGQPGADALRRLKDFCAGPDRRGAVPAAIRIDKGFSLRRSHERAGLADTSI